MQLNLAQFKACLHVGPQNEMVLVQLCCSKQTYQIALQMSSNECDVIIAAAMIIMTTVL